MVSEVGNIILGAAQRHGVNPNALSTIAHLESRGNPMAKNPRSSAGGLFQFIDSTANAYGLQDRFDPVQASDAAARLTKDNAGVLQRALGRDPSIGELYLAHQQGAGGATKLLSNPNARAVDIVGADAVRLNGGRADMTAQEFANLWINKANRVAGQAQPDFVAGQGSASLLGSEGNDNMAEQPQGLLGGTKLGEFLTPDRRDHLIAALEGMTLNPNQALIQAAGGRIQQRQQDRARAQQANRTAEFLRQRGRDDLAAAVESGGIDPRAAVQTALAPPADDRTALIKNYQFAQAQGFQGSLTDFQNQSGSGTNITVNTGSETSKFGPAPTGTVWALDEKGEHIMENVPGTNIQRPMTLPLAGTAAEKRAQEVSEAGTKNKAAAERAQDSINLIDSIIQDPALPGIVGMVQGRVPPVTQAGTDLNVKINQLKGQAFLQAFETLKGGGQITEREGIAAQNAIARLDRAQSDDAYIAALNELKDIAQRGLRRARGEAVDDQSSGAKVTNATGNIAVDPSLLEFMTPEERALFE